MSQSENKTMPEMSREEKLKITEYDEAARVIHLYLNEFCDESLPFPAMVADAARKADKEIKAIKDENEKLKQLFAVQLDLVAQNEKLEQQNKMLIEITDSTDVTLAKIENYLHHNTDNLCGDDCIGDKKLTMRFENRIIQIQKARETIAKVNLK